MSLQFKDEAENMKLNLNDDRQQNPWDIPEPIENLEPYYTSKVGNTQTVDIYATEKQGNLIVGLLVKIVIGLVICGALVFGGKAVVEVAFPSGEDITELLRKDERTIASELGMTFVNDSELVPQIHQYSNGVVTVHANEDIGIVYIDGKQAGVHIRNNKYTMYNIQIGDGEQTAYNQTSYPFEASVFVLNDMAEGKTTTYFYYNTERNDCVAITINDTTNRVVGLTYFYDYNRVVETLDS